MFDKNTVLTSIAILYKEDGSKKKWLLVRKAEDADWELPKVTVRKTESSARASIRMTGEMMGMNTQILEEVGRTGGMTTVNGKSVPQKHLYYLMRLRSQSGEGLGGFFEQAFFEFPAAQKKLTSKREKQMLVAARDELKVVLAQKDRVALMDEEDNEMMMEADPS